MKILLDECVTKKLKLELSEYNVYTVFEMSWSGLKNGELISKAIDYGFDLFITIDKNISYQQNIEKYDISLVVFCVDKSKIEHLRELIPEFKKEVNTYEKKKYYKIKKKESL